VTQVNAKLKYVRMTPRKMMMVANEIRGKAVQNAIDYLTFCRRRAARPLLKLVKSAVASANQKGGIDVDTLYIKELLVDKGPTMRRWMPRARGMATPILKRTSHVKLVLEERS
jgi:large subunit ribosomal protein L22